MTEVTYNRVDTTPDGVLADACLKSLDLQNDASSPGTWMRFGIKKYARRRFENTSSAVERYYILKTNWAVATESQTEEDLVSWEDNKAQELIFQFKTSESIPFRIEVANRILELFNYAKEEDPDCSGIKFGSLYHFINFFRYNKKLRPPNISLTADNTIYARWRDKQKGLFSVVFLPTGDVQFVIFKPNKKHPEKKIRISGIATADTLMETVTPHNIQSWAENER